MLDPLDQYPAVPGAVEDGHPAPPWDEREEAPHEVMTQLARRGCGERGNGVVPGVDGLCQPTDRPSLAGGVPPLHDHEEWRTNALLAVTAGARADEATADQSEVKQPSLEQDDLFDGVGLGKPW